MGEKTGIEVEYPPKGGKEEKNAIQVSHTYTQKNASKGSSILIQLELLQESIELRFTSQTRTLVFTPTATLMAEKQ